MFNTAMYVCLCHAVTESDLVDAIAQGADSVDALQTLTGAGTGCGSCLGELEVWAARATARRLPVLSAEPSYREAAVLVEAVRVEATLVEATIEEERTAA